MQMKPGQWASLQRFTASVHFTCGYCGKLTGTKDGYINKGTGHDVHGKIAICQACNRPTYFEDDQVQVPNAPYGSSVPNVPPKVGSLYDEARRCIQVSAFTACTLLARKLLMNICVDLGAAPGESFAFYVGYLESSGYVTPKVKGWVDRIRMKGNKATHEIDSVDSEEAKEIVSFTEMILKLVYDYPNRGEKVATA